MHVGNLIGRYQFFQHPHTDDESLIPIGIWDKLSSNITIDESLVSWEMFERTVHKEDMESSVPHSVCSYPCGRRQYRHQRELACCWDCITCRNNEIINSARNGCDKCPDLTWPDDETATSCIDIEPEYVYLESYKGIMAFLIFLIC